MFRKILIANRGAIARRIVRACAEMGVPCVAVYSDADKDAPHLAEAGETVPLAGVRAEQTYLNSEALLNAMAESGADAVHPGYGFLAENAHFAEAVGSAGATFIGPSPKWLRQMGDKTAARTLRCQPGFPGAARFRTARGYERGVGGGGWPGLSGDVETGGRWRRYRDERGAISGCAAAAIRARTTHGGTRVRRCAVVHRAMFATAPTHRSAIAGRRRRRCAACLRTGVLDSASSSKTGGRVPRPGARTRAG